MATTHPYAINTGSTISGTTQVGDLAIGTNGTYDFSTNPGGVTWYMGPDEDLGYVIVHPDYEQNRPRFKRTDGFSDELLLDKVNELAGIYGHSSFTGLTDATDWMSVNEYPISEHLALELTWDNIANVPVADASSVSNWNAFFNLPTNGTPFTSVIVDGNIVKLYGGTEISIPNNLMVFTASSDHLISVDDKVGCVTQIGTNAFGYYPEISNGCPYLETISFPNVTLIDTHAFWYATGLINVNIPKVNTLAYAAFKGCNLVNTYYLPAVVNISQEVFGFNNSLVSLYIPQCLVLGNDYDPSFQYDNVFENINENDITITVPSYLMTCNGGNPDADIQYLQTNNSVTIIQV